MAIAFTILDDYTSILSQTWMHVTIMSCASRWRCILQQEAPCTHCCPHCNGNLHVICGKENPQMLGDDFNLAFSHVCLPCWDKHYGGEQNESVGEGGGGGGGGGEGGRGAGGGQGRVGAVSEVGVAIDPRSCLASSMVQARGTASA